MSSQSHTQLAVSAMRRLVTKCKRDKTPLTDEETNEAWTIVERELAYRCYAQRNNDSLMEEQWRRLLERVTETTDLKETIDEWQNREPHLASFQRQKDEQKRQLRQRIQQEQLQQESNEYSLQQQAQQQFVDRQSYGEQRRRSNTQRQYRPLNDGSRQAFSPSDQSNQRLSGGMESAQDDDQMEMMYDPYSGYRQPAQQQQVYHQVEQQQQQQHHYPQPADDYATAEQQQQQFSCQQEAYNTPRMSRGEKRYNDDGCHGGGYYGEAPVECIHHHIRTPSGSRQTIHLDEYSNYPRQ